MDNLVKSFEDDKHILDIVVDDYAENPRKFCENPSTLVCFCSKYDIGDLNFDKTEKYLYRKELAKLLDPIEGERIDTLLNVLTSNTSIEIKAEVDNIIWKVLDDNTVILPVYLLDHSGLRLSTRDFMDQWDSGHIGYIFVKKDKIPEYGIEIKNGKITQDIRNKVIEILEKEIEEYDGYVSGYCHKGILYAKDLCYYCNGSGNKYISPQLGFEVCRACNQTKYLRREICDSSTYYGYTPDLFRKIANELLDELNVKLLKKIVKEKTNE